MISRDPEGHRDLRTGLVPVASVQQACRFVGLRALVERLEPRRLLSAVAFSHASAQVAAHASSIHASSNKIKCHVEHKPVAASDDPGFSGKSRDVDDAADNINTDLSVPAVVAQKTGSGRSSRVSRPLGNGTGAAGGHTTQDSVEDQLTIDTDGPSIPAAAPSVSGVIPVRQSEPAVRRTASAQVAADASVSAAPGRPNLIVATTFAREAPSHDAPHVTDASSRATPTVAFPFGTVVISAPTPATSDTIFLSTTVDDVARPGSEPVSAPIQGFRASGRNERATRSAALRSGFHPASASTVEPSEGSISEFLSQWAALLASPARRRSPVSHSRASVAIVAVALADLFVAVYIIRRGRRRMGGRRRGVALPVPA